MNRATWKLYYRMYRQTRRMALLYASAKVERQVMYGDWQGPSVLNPKARPGVPEPGPGLVFWMKEQA